MISDLDYLLVLFWFTYYIKEIDLFFIIIISGAKPTQTGSMV